ncbi:PLP-dependent aminotransferase family protein [Pseudoflavitalea sp. G-6-1-2]|uniref:MocR-like pyridoxine biosynthesis transcription factor PdxR n=1 Tax=Pseudoflavitalea sp. G-6-1-2 TaxID=2728841 RepID=UPI00146AFFA4|nr:PLP-dependent aminotransferase family protein [Pseudoflavitalea sp. G-6-1-2]NML22636.1 PLP-dependent aminotransferase family protein [Pseudoflavitalea sp. G-6-1-2]
MAKERSGNMLAGIRLSRNSDQPLYMQLYAQLRDKIKGGQLQPGDRIPSSRAFSIELGVSRIIVSQCFEQLIMEGYFEARTGSGTFVAAVLPEQLLQVRNGQSPATKSREKNNRQQNTTPRTDTTAIILGSRIEDNPFQIGLPALDKFPFQTWQKVAANILKQLKQYHLGYEDSFGYPGLRQKIADYLRVARGVNCDADQVVVVTGSQQTLNLVLQVLLKPGDKVWIEDPGYYGAKLAFEYTQMKLCPVPVDKDGMNVTYGIQHFPDAKLAYVTPTHQFPLGVTLSDKRRQQLLQWAHENNSWILEDDYDSEYRYEGLPAPCLQHYDQHARVIYTGTFSKVLFPGLRLAYLVLPSSEMIKPFKKIKEIVDRQSPALEQYILHDFMEQGYFTRHIHKMRLLYAERRIVLMRLLQQQLTPYLDIIDMGCGMHLVCKLNPKVNSELLKNEIRERKIKVSFVDNYTLQHPQQPAILLGFTAYTPYRLKIATEKLRECFEIASGNNMAQ